MLLVNTYIDISLTHRLGLFAKNFIKKGSPIWIYHPQTTELFFKSDYLKFCEELSLHSLKEIINHSYIRNGKVYFSKDNTKFVNHSNVPNIALIHDDLEVAVQDIYPGEELTENYLISYDTNDFYHFDFNATETKDAVIDLLRKILFRPGRPKVYMHLNAM